MREMPPIEVGIQEVSVVGGVAYYNVRILKFDRIAFFVIGPILELCRMFPHLEHLILNNVSTVAVTKMRTYTQDQPVHRTTNLNDSPSRARYRRDRPCPCGRAPGGAVVLLAGDPRPQMQRLPFCHARPPASAKALPLVVAELAPQHVPFRSMPPSTAASVH